MEQPVEDQTHLFDRLLFQNDAMIYQLGQLMILGRALLVIQALSVLLATLHLALVLIK